MSSALWDGIVERFRIGTFLGTYLAYEEAKQVN